MRLQPLAVHDRQFLPIDPQRLQSIRLRERYLRLTYDIAGNDGQVTLRVYNKTSQPLTINWQRSAFIRNQQTVSFLNKDVIIHSHTVSIAAIARPLSAPSHSPTALASYPPAVRSATTFLRLAKTGPLQVYLPDSLPQKELADPNGINSVKFRQVHYDETNSPIRFSSYITFSIGHDNKEFSLTNNFYVSEVYQADGGPGIFSLYHGHGDQIFIHQKTNNTGLADDQPTASSHTTPTSF